LCSPFNHPITQIRHTNTTALYNVGNQLLIATWKSCYLMMHIRRWRGQITCLTWLKIIFSGDNIQLITHKMSNTFPIHSWEKITSYFSILTSLIIVLRLFNIFIWLPLLLVTLFYLKAESQCHHPQWSIVCIEKCGAHSK